MARHIILLASLLALALAQQEFPLFEKSELMGGDGSVLSQINPGFIGQNNKYLFFWVPLNESDGMIVFYARNNAGQYTEVNRLMGSRMAGTALNANNEWFVSYDGSTRDVNFWKMDANHQVTNNFTWAYKQLSGFANSIHLLSNNNMVALDYTARGYELALYPFSNNDWPVTPSSSVLADPWAGYTVSESRAATYDKASKIVTIYSIDNDQFNFVENVSVPFSFDSSSVPYTYNGEDTLVFILSSTQIGFLEKNDTKWIATIVNREDDGNLYYNNYFLWRGSDLYYSSIFNQRNTNVTNGSPQGSLFKLSRLAKFSWNITEIYSSTKDISNLPNFITTHFWGFTVTDKAVYSLSMARNKTYGDLKGASQLLYLPFCYNDPIALTCRDKSYLSCNPVNIDVSELYSIDDDCAEVSVNGSASIAVTFDANNSFKTTISVSRFEQTAQCEVTVLCNVEPVASNSPNSPGTNNTPNNRAPSTQQTSSSTIIRASLLLGLVGLLF